jgi:hypothetical protein
MKIRVRDWIGLAGLVISVIGFALRSGSSSASQMHRKRTRRAIGRTEKRQFRLTLEAGLAEKIVSIHGSGIRAQPFPGRRRRSRTANTYRPRNTTFTRKGALRPALPVTPSCQRKIRSRSARAPPRPARQQSATANTSTVRQFPDDCQTDVRRIHCLHLSRNADRTCLIRKWIVIGHRKIWRAEIWSGAETTECSLCVVSVISRS